MDKNKFNYVPYKKEVKSPYYEIEIEADLELFDVYYDPKYTRIDAEYFESLNFDVFELLDRLKEKEDLGLPTGDIVPKHFNPNYSLHREYKIPEGFTQDEVDFLDELEFPYDIEFESPVSHISGFNILYIDTDGVSHKVTQKENLDVKLTDDEKGILRNLNKEHKWISRNLIGVLFIHQEKPFKDNENWNVADGRSSVMFYDFSHLFQFIKWEDKEAYNIKELLKGE